LGARLRSYLPTNTIIAKSRSRCCTSSWREWGIDISTGTIERY